MATTKHATKRCGRLTLAVGMFVLLALATSQAQTIQSVDELTVVDSAGKKVGRLIDTGAEKIESYVAFQVAANKSIVKLAVLADGYGSDDELAFESVDCSGTPYLSVYDEPHGLFARAAVGPPGHTLYVENGPSRLAGTQSVYFEGECQFVGGSQGEVVPVLSALDLDMAFAPPFHLVAASPSSVGCCGDCNGDRTVTVDEILTSVNYALYSCPAP
jgi:hypothetical protein